MCHGHSPDQPAFARLAATPWSVIFHPMSGDPRFLVIDDEKQIRRAVAYALQALGGRVSEAATGREGIDLAAAESPGLIVLDLGLPDPRHIVTELGVGYRFVT